MTNATDKIGIVTNDHYLVRQLNSGEEQLYALLPRGDTLSSSARRKMQQSLSELAMAIFETSRYLILNNKK